MRIRITAYRVTYFLRQHKYIESLLLRVWPWLSLWLNSKTEFDFWASLNDPPEEFFDGWDFYWEGMKALKFGPTALKQWNEDRYRQLEVLDYMWQQCGAQMQLPYGDMPAEYFDGWNQFKAEGMKAWLTLHPKPKQKARWR